MLDTPLHRIVIACTDGLPIAGFHERGCSILTSRLEGGYFSQVAPILMRFLMKAHIIRCVFALQMHLNACVFIRKRISLDATVGKAYLYSSSTRLE